jgi:hypothetical protein
VGDGDGAGVASIASRLPDGGVIVMYVSFSLAPDPDPDRLLVLILAFEFFSLSGLELFSGVLPIAAVPTQWLFANTFARI